MPLELNQKPSSVFGPVQFGGRSRGVVIAVSLGLVQNKAWKQEGESTGSMADGL